MKEKFVLLRGGPHFPRDPFRGPAATDLEGPAGVTERLSIDVEDVEIDDRTALTRWSRDESVVAAAPVMPMRLIAPVSKRDDDPNRGSQARTDWGITAVRADRSHYTGHGIVIAVLDTGIDSIHPAFADVELIEQDFTGEGNGDRDGHGTHCAGTIFGLTTEQTRIGVAPGIKTALIGKVLGGDGGSSDQIVHAVMWAIQNGANVISMSLGIDFPGFQRQLQEEHGFPPEIATDRALEGYRMNVRLFERLASMVHAGAAFFQPAMIIAAAGNESRREIDPGYEVSVSPPAVSDGMLAVGALGRSAGGLEVAPFSNTGVDLCGPGVDVLSARFGGGVAISSGTSMAAPYVAGVAALWAEKLKQGGTLPIDLWTARLLSSGSLSQLRAGFRPAHVGAGLVQAPVD